MRSVPVVRINVVLAPKSCNFPEVAVVVEHFFPVSNFLDTSTRGTENGLSLLAVRMGPLHLFSRETTNEASPVLFRILTEYKISLPRVNEWHLFPIPLLESASQPLGAVKKMCRSEWELEPRKEGGPSWTRQRADGAFQRPGPLLYLCPKRISKKETSLFQTMKKFWLFAFETSQNLEVSSFLDKEECFQINLKTSR